MFILLWVRDELNYDQFHKNYDRIHVVIANRGTPGNIFTDYNMVLPLAGEVEAKIPQVKRACVATQGDDVTFRYGDILLKKNGLTTSANFFQLFSWKFIKGDAVSAVADPLSIILTKSAAKAIFGNKDPMDQALTVVGENRNLKVTGIIEDPPGNSSFQFDFIRLFNFSDPETRKMLDEWVNSSWRVYVETVPGADIDQVTAAINAIKRQHDPGDKTSTYFTFPMSKWRLYSDFKDGKNVGGMIEYVRLFTVIAVVILLIACINFMNLSTSRSEKRSKEVGIRKTLGSGRIQLALQFICESTILVLLAFLLSLAVVFLLLTPFNTLVNKQLSLEPGQPYFWLGSLAIILFTGIVVGSYPALYLSAFNPVRVLKGIFSGGKSGILPRHFLVVGQFVVSILLISATIIVYQQIQYLKNRNIGYSTDNLIMVDGTNDIKTNFSAIKQELLSSRLVQAVARSNSPITQIWWRMGAPHWEGRPEDFAVVFSGIRGDKDFIQTMGIKILQGKSFSGMPVDSTNVLLNRSAVELMGLKNPIGTVISFGDEKYHVIGVTENVVMESPYRPVEPMLTFYSQHTTGILSLRLAEGVLPQQALPFIESVFKKYNPAYPFDYRFADVEFGRKFLTEELISKITNIFSALAIFICCLGLAGLASFTVEKRFREIGIRKVLGATVSQVIFLISRQFLKLVLISFVIAVPLTWWSMHNWLENYAYHIRISVWVFFAVGLLILLLALVIVSVNTVRAALANPVKSLRSE
ncbi:ABC transporter permease [Olivibacter ginsenosidimutans]|uniref:ABC transporter permease n=2 Tax=Olivibacter ginsenosidimutans TaxID=1176537 RepID=A0ABP9AW96_9SPHI